MADSNVPKILTFYFRLAMGWTFLYAGAWQLLANFDAAGFLQHTKTFHDFFILFASPAIVPYTDFLVKWGHLLIGLSLVTGLMVRVSAPFGMFLLGIYYFAHMDFPYIESNVNMIMDYHLVYIGVLAYLVIVRAGHVWGLDGVVEKFAFFDEHPSLRPLVH